jgi:serine/threonine-protein phosphatase 4 regulatory subunit 4
LSEDEIKRLTIDENLSEIQRCLVLLKKPEHDQ